MFAGAALCYVCWCHTILYLQQILQLVTPLLLPCCLLQMMAVLSESLMYCTEGSLRMQALSAWLGFVQLLAAHAPAVLKRVAAQAAVVLLPVLELASQEGSAVLEAAHALAANEAGAGAAGMQAAGEVDAAAVKLAAEVLHEIVVRQRMHVCDALRNMPPLPSLDVLKEVNAVLAQVRVAVESSF